MWQFLGGVVFGALIVFGFYARLFKRLESAVRGIIAQRDQYAWDRDAAIALYKGNQIADQQPDTQAAALATLDSQKPKPRLWFGDSAPWGGYFEKKRDLRGIN